MPIPERITNPGLNDYLEVMTKAIFQAGLKWSLIDAKWDNFRKAFSDFDVSKVASFDSVKVSQLLEDPGIIRSRSKIEATIKNAQEILVLDRIHGGFKNYLGSFKSYDDLAADIRKRFKFMGEMNVYYLLFRCGEPVPNFEDWITTIPGDHPRMREMIEHARSQDRLRQAG